METLVEGLGFTEIGDTIKNAREKSYKAVIINFDGIYYGSDIIK
jgi:hypothetical protein